MNLLIDNKDKLNLDQFCIWLIDFMQKHILEFIDEKRLVPFDDYINTNNIIRWHFKEERPIKTKDIIIGSLYNLEVNKINNKYNIVINPNSYIPNSYSRYIDLARLVNYGNLQLAPYHLFDEFMQYFADNITVLYNEYIEEN